MDPCGTPERTGLREEVIYMGNLAGVLELVICALG